MVGDPYVLHRQAATDTVLQRYEDAAATLAALRRLADTHADRSPWLPEMAARADTLRRQLTTDQAADLAALLAGMGEQRRRRGLPATDD